MKNKLTTFIAFALVLSLFGCNAKGNGTSSEATSSDSTTVTQVNSLDTSNMFSNEDKEIGYDESQCIQITLNGDSAGCTDESVKISGSTVTITSEGIYLISGTLTNGQIIVDCAKSDKPRLILKNASINCDTSAAIYVKEAEKVFITLASDTENKLENKKDFVQTDSNNVDSVIFSKSDLTINGSGTLTINAEYGHGIVSKDDLIITGGSYNITSASHGITGKDSVRITKASFKITSGKDGIHGENADDASLGYIYIASGEFDITSENDGLDSSYILWIDAGNFNIVTGGGSENASKLQNGNDNPDWGKFDRPQRKTTSSTSTTTVAADTSSTIIDTATDTPSAKGLKAGVYLLVNSGSFKINSSDDSIHSNSDVCLNDGSFTITSGDDGMHADSKVVINGGKIEITKSYEGIEGQSISIAGGDISLVSSDDGLNAAGGNDQSGQGGRPGQGNFSADSAAFINISGGTLNISAAGDGVDSNGSLTISGGETYVSGPTNSGNGALDYDSTAKITGGIFVAAGSSGMAQNFSDDSTQGSILVTTNAIQAAKSLITLKDSSGKVILTYTSSKQYNCVVVSSPAIKKNETYTLQIGNESSEIEMTGLIYGGGNGMGGFAGGGMGGNGGDKSTPPDGGIGEPPSGDMKEPPTNSGS